jgi:hypothetical protein
MRLAAMAGAKRRQRRGRKRQRRLLRQPDRLVDGPRGLAEARLVRVQAFDVTQNGKEIEFVRPLFDRL